MANSAESKLTADPEDIGIEDLEIFLQVLWFPSTIQTYADWGNWLF